MSDDATRTRCVAITKAGNPCKNFALPGMKYCRVHHPQVEEDFALPVEEQIVSEPVDTPDDGGESNSDEVLMRELVDELDELILRLKEVSPGYTPPPFSPRALIKLIRENFKQCPPEFRLGILLKLRQTIGEDYFDPDTWRGIWYMVNYTVEYQSDLVKRRFTGEFETDEWGLDWEVVEAVRPFMEFLYYKYWRVEATGLEYVPEEGRALLVSNHSGQLPFDGVMIGVALYNEHPAQRLVRSLYASWFTTLPVFSTLFTRLGQAQATEENGIRLLNQDELVAVFPEGYKGVSKLFKDRYQLARFGRGGFIRMAIKSQAPIIPVSVVGAEETYISLANSTTIARMFGFPFFPISPRWPWLGPLGLIPLPTKWYIDFGEPIAMDAYPAEEAINQLLVSQLTDQVRNTIQEMIYSRLELRKSVFFSA